MFYVPAHAYTHTQPYTHTHRTKMTNTWYRLFNITSAHTKRTCILSCSLRSLTITHAGTCFARRNDNNYTTLLISPFNTSQSNKQKQKRRKKKNNNCHHSFQLNSKCIKMHFSASKDRKKFQCKLTEDIIIPAV